MCLAPKLKLRLKELPKFTLIWGMKKPKLEVCPSQQGQKTWLNVFLGKKRVLKGERMVVKATETKYMEPIIYQTKASICHCNRF